MENKVPYEMLLDVVCREFFREDDEINIISSVVADLGSEQIVTYTFSTDRPDKSGVYIEFREIKKK